MLVSAIHPYVAVGIEELIPFLRVCLPGYRCFFLSITPVATVRYNRGRRGQVETVNSMTLDATIPVECYHLPKRRMHVCGNVTQLRSSRNEEVSPTTATPLLTSARSWTRRLDGRAKDLHESCQPTMDAQDWKRRFTPCSCGHKYATTYTNQASRY